MQILLDFSLSLPIVGKKGRQRPEGMLAQKHNEKDPGSLNNAMTKRQALTPHLHPHTRFDFRRNTLFYFKRMDLGNLEELKQ